MGIPFDLRKARLVAEGFDFPTSVAFDAKGTPYVAESGLPFAGARPGGRVLRVEPAGRPICLVNELRQPLNGLAFHRGAFYLSEGGDPGRISRVTVGGQWSVVLDGLPGLGNYHTNMVAVGPDGKLYFSQGALTNSGVIGLDALELGWLKRLPHSVDIPGYDVVLAGESFETENPLEPSGTGRARTGPFSAFGTPAVPGQRIRGRVPCTASVMRCNPDGSGLELVAWGLRNAYGLGFLPDGRLLATDQGADDRGSRPIGDAPDLLFEVRQGRWYGWPDFIGDVPVTDERFTPVRGAPPRPILANHQELPPPERALLEFPTHVSAVKFDVAPKSAGAWAGHLVVALFGDERPMVAPPGPRAGRVFARVDPSDWSLHLVEGELPEPLHRPMDVRFHPLTGELYVLDFGEFEMGAGGVIARAGTGRLWRIPRD